MIIQGDDIYEKNLSKTRNDHFCSKEKLVQRLEQDVAAGVRTDDVIQRSVERIGLYQNLNTIKIDTSDKSVAAIVKEIAAL